MAYDIQTATTTGAFQAYGYNIVHQREAQTFTTVGAGTIAKVKIYLSNDGTGPTDNTLLNIFATDGTFPTGASLGQSGALDNSTLTGTSVQYTFNWASPVSVTAATIYAIVVSRSGADSVVNYGVLGGIFGSSEYGGGAWREEATGAWGTTAAGDVNMTITVVTTGGGGVGRRALLGVGA